MQEKFARTIKYFNEIVDTSSRVLDTCKVVNVPYLVTEHYPKGLGKTIQKIQEKVDSSLILEKTRFSMCTQGVLEKMDKIAPS